MKEILLKLKKKYPNDTDFGKKMREFLNDEFVLDYFDYEGDSLSTEIKQRMIVTKLKTKYTNNE